MAVVSGLSNADDLKRMNVSDQLSGYFFVKSALPDETALGGFGKSSNMPRSITDDLLAQPHGVILLAAPDQRRTFALDSTWELPVDAATPQARLFQGFTVLLLNNTHEAVWFAAQDSRLSIVREAIDENGQWRPIENLSESFCGNSSHRVALPAQHFWSFSTPVYQGSQRTLMRFRFDDIISNEFEGTVNPAQFDDAKSR